MNTIDLLWRYKFGGLDPHHIESWAIDQLQAGNDSAVIMELAACPDMHWQDRERCLRQVIEEMSLQELLEDDTGLLRAQEADYIRQFIEGDLSARDLIQIGESLFRQSDYHSMLSLWCELEEDLSLISYGERPLFGLLSPKDIDGSLRKTLIKEGRIHE